MIDYLKKNTKSLNKRTSRRSKLKRTYNQCPTENEAKEQLEKEINKKKIKTLKNLKIKRIKILRNLKRKKDPFFAFYVILV